MFHERLRYLLLKSEKCHQMSSRLNVISMITSLSYTVSWTKPHGIIEYNGGGKVLSYSVKRFKPLLITNAKLPTVYQSEKNESKKM